MKEKKKKKKKKKKKRRKKNQGQEKESQALKPTKFRVIMKDFPSKPKKCGGSCNTASSLVLHALLLFFIAGATQGPPQILL